MTNPVIPVIWAISTQLFTGGVDTGQMRRRFQTSSVFNTFNNAVRTVTLAGVRAVGHRGQISVSGCSERSIELQRFYHFTGCAAGKIQDVNLAVYFGGLCQRLPAGWREKAHYLTSIFRVSLFVVL